VNAASFHFMREHGTALMPRAAQGWDQGADRFLHAGTNGRWRNVLIAEDIARYEARVRRELSPSLIRWLEQGSRLAGDPRTLAD
jgi:aryl sulfotransferase